MSSPVNLQRDGVWTDLSTSDNIAFSGPSVIGNTTFLSSGPPEVQAKYAYVTSDQSAPTLMVANSTKAVGVYLQQPVLEIMPYRIKAFAKAIDGDHRFFIGMGYPQSAQTGTDDNIVQATFLPFDTEIDTVVMILPKPSTDGNYGKPINFSICAVDNALSNETIIATLSVQNLATSPPGFGQSVG